MKCVWNWYLWDIEFFSLFFVYFFILLPLCTPEQEGSRSIFISLIFDKLTVTYFSNLCHKICLELISTRDSILFLYFSCIFLYFCPIPPLNGKVSDRFSWRHFFYKITVTNFSNLCDKIFVWNWYLPEIEFYFCVFRVFLAVLARF